MVNMAVAAGEGQYIRRRQYYRLDCCVPLSFSLMKANKQGESFLEESHHGLIRDLSGGGMRMAAEFEMDEEDLIEFMFHLDREFFQLVGGIRSQIHFPGSNIPYMHGIMFMGLSIQRREKIISYLHRCQLMSMRLQNRSSNYYQTAKRTHYRHNAATMGQVRHSV